MGLAEVKTFKNLEDDVISVNRCCACGACIAYCENQAFNVIEMDNYTPKFKTDKSVENCKECGYCYYICPQTEPLFDKLKEAHRVKDELGNIIDIFAARTTDAKIKEIGQDGGIVSTILTYLFDTNNIDAAVVSEYDTDYKPIPKIIYRKEELTKSAGTRYSISPNILPLKDLTQVAEEIISHKKRIYDSDQIHLAFVGTPCQCRAISKMKLLNIKPAHVISVVISLFCFENFDYDKLMNTLKAKTQINPSNIKKTNIKKNFFVTSKDNSIKEVNIKDLDDAVRNHCHECDEFVGRFSDLSVGASGAPTGYSMILTRTEKGHSLIDSLLATGYIERNIIPADQISEWKPKKINWLKKMTSLKVKK
ncbi:MAG: Coenzyme F420 hydrogenase/dehydrogenase, beta subunit C-terminal domain [Promethearchaeota archaeon]